jgi:signal transduction histidine kinase
MTRQSLRLRLLVLSTLTIVAALTATGLALVVVFERHLMARVAGELAHRLTEIETLLVLDETGQPALRHMPADPRYRQPYGGAYWQIAADDGRLLRARSLWDQTLAPTGENGSVSPVAIETTGPNGAEIYVLERALRLGAGAREQVVRASVALDHAEIVEQSDAFRVDVVRALAVLAAILIAGAWAQIGFGLRPLTAVRAELAGVRSGARTRLGTHHPEEIAPLATDLNALLDRQEQMVRKARTRAGDLAHGLKTPLTVLATQASHIEAAGAGPSGRLVREQVRVMRAHIDRELARARAHGEGVGAGLLTDPAATVARLLRLMAPLPRFDQVDWHVDIADDIALQIDPDDFGEAMGNLLDNARKFAAASVWIAVAAEVDGFVVSVADDGPGIDPELKERVGERGWHGPDSIGGSGLGMAIVGDVLDACGSRLEIAARAQGGTILRFRLAGNRLASKPARRTG